MLAFRSRPKITGNRCQVGIFEERLEGTQSSLWLGSGGPKKNSNAAAGESGFHPRLPFQTKSGFSESIYGIDNNRESAA
jgi:hypothetical protein